MPVLSFFAGNTESLLARDAPHLAFGQFADGEKAALELRAGYRMQEIGLVLSGSLPVSNRTRSPEVEILA
jgi:hypothetical protein